jgi:hypothetical protein
MLHIFLLELQFALYLLLFILILVLIEYYSALLHKQPLIVSFIL